MISQLRCPYCDSSLEVIHGLDASTLLRSDYGVLRCGCAEYPVVEGIPILQHTDGLPGVISLIKDGESRGALLQALNVFRVKWAHRSRWHQFRYHLNCRQLADRENTTFEEAVNLVRRPKVFSDYLFHRYANPSFLAAVGVLQLLGSIQNSGSDSAPADVHTHRVLDLACGAGHSSFLMRLLFPRLSIVSADHDFVSLYLAKRFLAPDSVHVCIDAEVANPFPENYFDAVFCLDAFHYLHSKAAVVSELKRIVKSDGLWLFPHLHNALQKNITAGIPLSPEHYLRCFDSPDVKLFDESELVRGLTERHTLDLQRSPDMATLNAAPTLALVGGKTDLWRQHQDFPSALCKHPGNLTINPIYRASSSSQGEEWQLIWPNDVMKAECSEAEAILPRSWKRNRGELDALLRADSAADNSNLADLVAKFVLVALPPNYCVRN
jgi:SAM-dependent methyltransferase